MNELEIIELFCLVDDFTHRFEQSSSQKSIQYIKKRVRKRKFRTSLSEVHPDSFSPLYLQNI